MGAKLPYGCEGGMPIDGYTGGGGAGRYGVPAGPELFWLRPQLKRTREFPIG